MDDLKHKIDGIFHHHDEPAKGRDEDEKVYCCDDLGWVHEDLAHEHRSGAYPEGDASPDSSTLFKEFPRA
jgi:hypothetical protein